MQGQWEIDQLASLQIPEEDKNKIPEFELEEIKSITFVPEEKEEPDWNSTSSPLPKQLKMSS